MGDCLVLASISGCMHEPSWVSVALELLVNYNVRVKNQCTGIMRQMCWMCLLWKSEGRIIINTNKTHKVLWLERTTKTGKNLILPGPQLS